MSNIVYVGTSLDGYIADSDGGLDWLESIPNPENDDLGWGEFMERIDAIVMGRNTYETVLSFGVDWPYPKKVFVLSNTLHSPPKELEKKVEIVSGRPSEIVALLNDDGYENLYIDGGSTVQSFLEDDLIDELVITRLPILLGEGTPLFGPLPEHRMFEHVSTKVLLDAMVVSRYMRKRN